MEYANADIILRTLYNDIHDNNVIHGVDTIIHVIYELLLHDKHDILSCILRDIDIHIVPFTALHSIMTYAKNSKDPSVIKEWYNLADRVMLERGERHRLDAR